MVELQKFSREFLQQIIKEKSKNQQATVVALSGDLGAGKTTFTQSLAKELEIVEVVTSPTFNLIKFYQIENQEVNSVFDRLVHMDAYRLESLSELNPLRLEEEFLKTENLICIEWAEKIKTVLPENTIYLDFLILENNEREITIKNLA